MSTHETSHPPVLAPKVEDFLNNGEKAQCSTFDEDRLNLSVAHDGSRASRAALSFANEYLMQRHREVKNTRLSVVHVYDLEQQSALAHPFKKDTIESELTALDVSLGDKYTKHFVNIEEEVKLHKGGDATRKEGRLIVDWSFGQEEQNKGLDFMFFGFSGKNTASETELLASDVSYTLQHLRCSSIIIKQDNHLPDLTAGADGTAKPLHVCVCATLSHASEKALFDALRLTAKGDKITVFHSRIVEEEGSTPRDTADSYYKSLIEKIQGDKYVDREVRLVSVRHSGKGAAEDILAWVKSQENESAAPEDEVHMLFMGTDVRRLQEGKGYLGSTAGKIICKLNKPVVIAKYDPSFESVMSTEERMRAVPSFE